MAKADYYSCDLCGGKAFYDANIQDTRYPYCIFTDDDRRPVCDMQVLCVKCSETHEVIVQEQSKNVLRRMQKAQE
jgi:hypothetical protein